jgi:hypothetical protein
MKFLKYPCSSSIWVAGATGFRMGFSQIPTGVTVCLCGLVSVLSLLEAYTVPFRLFDTNLAQS